jgi:hypothetical protein
MAGSKISRKVLFHNETNVAPKKAFIKDKKRGQNRCIGFDLMSNPTPQRELSKGPTVSSLLTLPDIVNGQNSQKTLCKRFF